MKIIRTKDYADMSRKAANIISAQVIMKPDCVLGLATGGTPVGIYEKLVERYNEGDLDFSEVTSVNLDEYRGLPKEHPESYWSFMHRNLFDHVNIDPAHINLPDGTNMDAEAECKRYDAVTSASTSPTMPLIWAPTAWTWPRRPSRPTSASLTATRIWCPSRLTPWASAPSCRHARC